MIEWIDETSEQLGTEFSRENMMAIQGFIAQDTVFVDEKTIKETNAKGEIKTTVFNDDGSITETFVGNKTITKTTTFTASEIKEVIS